MTPPSPGGLDAQGQARQAVATAVKDCGPGVLADPALLGSILKHLLPGSPLEASLLVAASEAGCSSTLEQQVARVGQEAAVRSVAADLARSRALDPLASLWAVNEVARAMGYPVGEGVPPTPPPPAGATLPWLTPVAAPPVAPPAPWAGGGLPPPGPQAPPPAMGPPQPAFPVYGASPQQPYAASAPAYGAYPPARPPSAWGSPPPAMPPPAGMGYPPQPPAGAPGRNRTPMVLAALIGIVVVIAAYFGIAAAAKLPPFSVQPVASITCPSGEHLVTGACVAPATPTASVAPSPSLPISGTATGGYGDTASNPDDSFACAFNAISDDGVTVIAYLTVAGSDSTDTSSLCSGFEAQQYYDEVTSLTGSGAAYCWITSQDGGATLRFYTAPDGSDTYTHELCVAIFGAAGVSP